MSFAKLKRCGYLFKLFLLVLSVVLSVKLWKKYRLLQELQQSQQTAPFSDLNKDILIFNRVPKSGTEMFVKLLQRLSRKNNFTHYRYGQPVPRQLPSFVQISFANQILRIKSGLTTGLTYDRHVFYYDFHQYTNEPNPTWFSMIRDPVQKFISRYNYFRVTKYNQGIDSNGNRINKEEVTVEDFVAKPIDKCILQSDPECTFNLGQRYDFTIPYFCGQHDDCTVLGSSWALTQAIRNIDKSFPVVGALEFLNETLVVLEKQLPRFFDGITDVYYKQLFAPLTNQNTLKRFPSLKGMIILATNLTKEHEFYNFVVQRLHRQHRQINSDSI